MKLKHLIEYATRSPYSKNYGDWSTNNPKQAKENHPRKKGYFTRGELTQHAKDFAEEYGMSLEELDEMTVDEIQAISNGNAVKAPLNRNVPLQRKGEEPVIGQRAETRTRGRSA